MLIGPQALRSVQGEGGDLVYLLAILTGAVCYAINAILARHRPPAEPLVAAAGAMVAGSLIMLPIGGRGLVGQLANAAFGPFAAMVALTLVATALATVVFLKLVTVAGPSFTSFMNYLIPGWALLMGMTLIGERPPARGAPGAGPGSSPASASPKPADGGCSEAAATSPTPEIEPFRRKIQST